MESSTITRSVYSTLADYFNDDDDDEDNDNKNELAMPFYGSLHRYSPIPDVERTQDHQTEDEPGRLISDRGSTASSILDKLNRYCTSYSANYATMSASARTSLS